MRMPRKGKSNCMGEEVMGGGYVEYGVYKIATRKAGRGFCLELQRGQVKKCRKDIKNYKKEQSKCV